MQIHVQSKFGLDFLFSADRCYKYSTEMIETSDISLIGTNLCLLFLNGNKSTFENYTDTFRNHRLIISHIVVEYIF